MPLLDQILARFAAMNLGEAAAWLLAINVAMFVASVGSGELAVRLFRHRRVAADPDPLNRAEWLLAGSCVLLNTIVAIAGWLLWQSGWIRVRTGGGWRVLIDAVVLLIAMDLLMYVFHRIAHVRWIFPWVHATHHRYDRPRPLSLFVLNPAEVLGFGALWLLLLCVYSPNWTGMLLYLGLNLLFGTLGHLGVEPFPPSWAGKPILRLLGSSTFHAQHHGVRDVNYGFYTVLWDRICRTLR